MNRGTKLHLGCGLITPPGWINLDGSWNARFAKVPILRSVMKSLGFVPPEQAEITWSKDILIHDVRKPLPFPDNSMVAIYGSHMLEHLYLEEAKRLLHDCWRVLQPSGVLRMVVPDLRSMTQEYLNNAQSQQQEIAADRLNHRLLLRDTYPPPRHPVRALYMYYKDFHSHKWMYDGASLSHYFCEAGFIQVKEMALHQSRIDGIDVVEMPDRVENGVGVCVEGMKHNEIE